MGEYYQPLPISRLTFISPERSCVEPSSIELPITPESNGSFESLETSDEEEAEQLFQQEIQNANEAFEGYKTSERGLGRIKKPILQAMCRSRGLEAGSKEKVNLLVERLVAWVCDIH